MSRGAPQGEGVCFSYQLTQQPEHIRDLLPVLKTHGVRSVLLGVDFWWFNKDWQTYRLPSFEALRTRPEAKQYLQARLFALRSLSKTLFRHRDRLMTAVRERRQGLRPGGYVPIGLAAQLGSGFRGSDGSRRDERFLERTRKGDPYQDGMETLERIARHNSLSPWGPFSERNCAELIAMSRGAPQGEGVCFSYQPRPHKGIHKRPRRFGQRR